MSFPPLLENVILRPVHPVDAGVKLTFTLILCPAGTISGRFELEAAEAVNWASPAMISERVTLFCPVFVTATREVEV
jgi:hypothetical protein